MSDKIFIDTNVLAYMIDTRDVRKQNLAKTVVSKLVIEKKCCISTQVLNEFFNAAVKKLKYTKDEAKKLVLSLMNLEVQEIDVMDILHAIEISIRTQFSYWDSLMIQCAIKSGCNVFYTEDLNDSQTVENLRIVNPFN